MRTNTQNQVTEHTSEPTTLEPYYTAQDIIRWAKRNGDTAESTIQPGTLIFPEGCPYSYQLGFIASALESIINARGYSQTNQKKHTTRQRIAETLATPPNPLAARRFNPDETLILDTGPGN